jgi:hypothetical protein
MGNTKITGKVIRYAGFDKKTGRIVHMHSRFSVQENRFVEIPVEELTARFSKDTSIVAKLSDRDPSNLDFLKVELNDEGERLGPMQVDPVARRLVARPRLVLTADKRELVGDGQDSAKIGISVVDATGNAVPGASGAVQITTDRGRLSNRGGIVNLVSGQAATTLTSVNETVRRIRVTATSPDGKFSPGYVDLAFL